MASDANGIGGGNGPRKPGGLPPPQAQGRGARPARAPLGVARPNAAGQPRPAGGGTHPGVAPNGAKAPARFAATQQPRSKADAASAERTRASAQAFAAEQAKDGVDAQSSSTRGPSTPNNKRGRNTDDELHRVAKQPKLDPLVLPAPDASPINPQQAAQLLARLTALSGATAATVGAPPSVDASGNATFTPQMLRYAKNEVGLTPRAYKALVALVGGAAVGQAAASTNDAATNDATTNDATPHAGMRKIAPAAPFQLAAEPVPASPVVDKQAPQEPAPGAAPDAKQPSSKVPDGPPTIEVAHANGLVTTLQNNDAYNLRYKGTMSWTAFSKLVTHDQLKAILTLALLRQIEVGWQNNAQQWATKLDVVHTQTQVAFDRLGAQLDLLSSIVNMRSSWIQGKSRPLRNENANKSTFEDEIGIRLETNSKGSAIRSEILDMTESLKAKQKSAGDILARNSYGNEILDAVPAVRGSAAEPARTLPRWTLSTDEQKEFTGAERDKYQELIRKQRVEEDMDASSKFGRLVYEADMLQKAAEQTRRASQAERAAGQPETAQRYEALARAYDHRVDDLRRQAVNSGYLGAIHSATRSNRAQFKMAIDRELKDLDAVQKQMEPLQKKGDARTVQETAELRKLQVYEQDRLFRVGGMHAAVTTMENQQGRPSLGRQVSGSQSLVERTRTLLTGVREAIVGTPPREQAEGALNSFLSGMHPQAARANLLSESFSQAHDTFASQPHSPVGQAMAALGKPNVAQPDARAHAATVHDWLKQNDPRYVEHLPGSDRARMARHTTQRQPWDQATPAHAERLAAERTFWAHNPELAEPPVGETGRLRKAMNVMHAPADPSRNQPRVGALPGDDPVFGPLYRFAAGGPQSGNGLDPAARADHLGNLAADARAWSQGYQDKAFDFASMALAYAGKVQAAATQMGQSAAHAGEGDASELSGMIDEARDGVYSALAQAQGDVQGLVQQLMSLLKVG